MVWENCHFVLMLLKCTYMRLCVFIMEKPIFIKYSHVKYPLECLVLDLFYATLSMDEGTLTLMC